MTRDLFIESIAKLEKQTIADINFAEKMGELFPDAYSSNLIYDNNLIIGQFLKILKTSTGDLEEDWIGYFCFELDFGKKYKKGTITDTDGSFIDFSDSGKVWDYFHRK